MSKRRKRPLCGRGSWFIHRRAKMGIKAASERRYFTRYTTGKAKPEVRS